MIKTHACFILTHACVFFAFCFCVLFFIVALFDMMMQKLSFICSFVVPLFVVFSMVWIILKLYFSLV